MAKRRKHGRDTPRIANERRQGDFEPFVLPVVHLPKFSPLVRSQPSRDVEDHRTWHPDPIRTPRLRSGRPALVILPKAKRPATPKVAGRRLFRDLHQLAFRTPNHVQLCVRRKQRREVILAMGRGGANHRRPRRNSFSNVRC